LARRNAEVTPEQRAERTKAFEATVETDFGYRKAGLAEQMSGVLQATVG
jgi:hypothetical protein